MCELLKTRGCAVALALVVAGCAEGTEDGVPSGTLEFATEPTVVPNENGARLVAWLDLETTSEATVTAEIDDGSTVRTLGPWEKGIDHHEMLLGFYADTSHTITVTATDDDGNTITSEPITYESGSLPFCSTSNPGVFPCIPEITVTSDPSKMEPGVTLVGLGGFLLMVDNAGEVVWFYDTGAVRMSGDVTPQGTMAIVWERERIEERDLSGALIDHWRAAEQVDVPASAIPVDVPAMHHDVVAMPEGGWLALSVELRTITDYPTSESNEDAPTADTLVAGDRAIHFARDGSMIDSWDMLDLLDPRRIGYDSLTAPFWDPVFMRDDISDWSHANAIWYDEPEDEVILSLRHQDAVVAVERSTGELSWIMAPNENWGAGPWLDALLESTDPPPAPMQPGQQYHQHGVKATPWGTVVMFDNGNNRQSAFGTPKISDEMNFSRALEVAIDREAGTWSTVFQFGEELNLYAPTLGDVDPMPNTMNLLVTYGNLDEPGMGSRVVEVTRDKEVVFDLIADGPLENSRSQRLTVIPGR